MKKYTLFIIIVAAILSVACSHDNKQMPEEQKTVGTSTSIKGDSTIYGLACYGCTDTVLIFLPGKGGDPVTYNILQATKNHLVIGKPKVGDWVAIIKNGKDSTKADMVIDLDQLKGTWVSQVMPTLRERIAQNFDDPEGKAREDSMLKRLMKPIEMGFALKQHYKAQAVGRRHVSEVGEESPVIYPTPRNYSEWHVINGRLVLTALPENPTKGKKKEGSMLENDTAEFILMTPDSLRLRFKSGERGFYRK
ncbi:MAG: hypothetical protein K5893_12670 [Prevotella sp.]|nr:hypothetical protein [Prevotella sp.]